MPKKSIIPIESEFDVSFDYSQDKSFQNTKSHSTSSSLAKNTKSRTRKNVGETSTRTKKGTQRSRQDPESTNPFPTSTSAKTTRGKKSSPLPGKQSFSNEDVERIKSKTSKASLSRPTSTTPFTEEYTADPTVRSKNKRKSSNQSMNDHKSELATDASFSSTKIRTNTKESALPTHLRTLNKTFVLKDIPRLHSAYKKWTSLDIYREEPHFSPQFKQGKRSFRRKNTEVNPEKQTSQERSSNKLMKKSLKVIPLGGLCEVGRNMTAIEYGDDMIIVDVGVSFPDEKQPGIDHVIPNMEYVIKNRQKLRAVFITHGHEDHIGSISYLIQQLPCILYTPALAGALMQLKLEEKGLAKKADMRIVKAGDKIKAGVFQVEFIHVNHSIADSCCLAIRTPIGTILHTGDFKIDYTPVHGAPIDIPRLAQVGAEGVLLLMCESTNVEKAGFSMSESKVGQCFSDAFSKAQGRIIVATFSSNVHRIQQIVQAAEQNNRKVALIGRSMQNVFRAASKLGYINHQANTMIDIDKIDSYPANEIVIITTGSQGEPLAALTRMAFSDHRQIEITAQDTVIISSTPIPGNEKPIYRVINELYKKRATVIYSAMAEVHVSGHAYREEMKLMHQLIRPKYFMPIHGEYRMLYEHGKLANELGQPWDSIFIMNNGDILQITEKDAKIADFFSCEPVLIDGKSSTTLDNRVLDDRLNLAEEGVVSIALCYDSVQQTVLGDVALQTRGFDYKDDMHDLKSEVNDCIEQFIRKTESQNKPLLTMLKSTSFRDRLADLLYKLTSRKPILLISIIEIEA